MSKLANIFARLNEKFGVWFSRTIIILLLAGIFFVTGGGISQNKKWQINTIEISGQGAISEDVVRSLSRQKIEGNYFFVYSRTNSYLFPKKEIESMLLETFPRISSALVRRVDNHTVSISLAERKPFALWCGENVTVKDCWFIDDTGFVFDKSPVFSKGVYIEMYGKIVEKNTGEPLRASLPQSRFSFATSFSKHLEESIGKPFRIVFKPEGEVEVTIQSSSFEYLAGVMLRLNDTSNPLSLVKTLKKAIGTEFPENAPHSKKLLYIDMRFGNKVIFGFEQ